MTTRPAFPRPMVLNQEMGRVIDSGAHGMTLAEYFAAQAPEQIPDWFVGPAPVWPDRPDPSAFFIDEKAQRAAVAWTRDPVYDLEEAMDEIAPGNREAAIRFAAAMDAYWDARRKTEDKAAVDKYFAWRAFYGKRLAEEVVK